MRSQKVSVDVWKMIMSSCSYLAVAFTAWVFLKLIYACFWFPEYLQKQHEKLSVVCDGESISADVPAEYEHADKKRD